jgi:hypothetical protein
MAYQFDSGIFSIEGLAGEILPDAKLYWYESGTSTPLATYSDEALTTPNANPVVADAAGRFPPIWLQPLNYKLVMTTSLDALLVTRDPINSETAGFIADLAAAAGSSLIGFQQAGSGASIRTVQAKLRDAVSPEDFGAVGDGVTDDSSAFLAALAAHLVVECNGSKHYVVQNLLLSNSQTIDGNGARFKSPPGADWMFKLTNYAAAVENFYISDATTCSEAAFVFDNGRFCGVSRGTIINASTAFVLKATNPLTGCVKPYIDDVNVETYSGIGIDVYPNVTQLEATDVFLDGAGGGATHGVRHVSTGSVIAHGGHTYTNVRCEGVETGWFLTDATLTEINGGWADTCSSVGMRITGSSDHININDFFIGTCTIRALSTEGSSIVYVNGLETFSNTDGVSVFGTSKLTMNMAAWRGPKVGFAVDAAATFVPIGADILSGTSVGTIPVSTTTFLGPNAVQASEIDTTWRMPYDGYILGIYGVCTVTPVSTHVYTARLATADAALLATVNPASFSATAWGSIPATKGQELSTKVATSTTNASRHATQLILAPQ